MPSEGYENISQVPSEQDSSILNRYLALRALRENLYLQQPGRYAMADVMEDLPGITGHMVGQAFNDVLPSAAIIPRDSEARRAQIAQAVDRLKAAKKDSAWEQAKENALSAGLWSIPATVAFHGLFGKLRPFNFPRVFKRLGRTAKAVGSKGLGKINTFTLPIADAGKVHKFSWKDFLPTFRGTALLGNPKVQRAAATSLGADVLGYGATGAAIGAVTPIITREASLSDKDIEFAQKQMQANPYLLSLPGTEIAAAIEGEQQKEDGKRSKLSRLATSALPAALLGGASMAAGAAGGLLVRAPALTLLRKFKMLNPATKKVWTGEPYRWPTRAYERKPDLFVPRKDLKYMTAPRSQEEVKDILTRRYVWNNLKSPGTYLLPGAAGAILSGGAASLPVLLSGDEQLG